MPPPNSSSPEGQPTPKRRVTMRDIAKVAGCHFTTVSLALRNHPGLPRETCERLRTLADKMGYVADPMLASLASYRSSLGPVGFHAVIGWVTNHPTRNGWRKTKIFEDYYLGAEKRARSLGYRLEEFWLREPGMTPARASQILKTRGITGLILAPQPGPAEKVNLDWDRFSTVNIGYSLTHPRMHVVCPNQYRGMRMALQKLQERGYKRPGLMIRKASDERVESNWSAGFLTGQRYLDEADRLPPLLLESWDEEKFSEWLALYQPDVVITKFEEAPEALSRLGLKVPHDIGLAFITLVEPGGKHSGVCENPEQVGGGAVEYLTGMLHRNEVGIPAQPKQLLIEPSWVDGEMVRAIPGTNARAKTSRKKQSEKTLNA